MGSQLVSVLVPTFPKPSLPAPPCSVTPIVHLPKGKCKCIFTERHLKKAIDFLVLVRYNTGSTMWEGGADERPL